MRTGAMAAVVLNSAKVDLGPWDQGKDLVGWGERLVGVTKKKQEVGKGKAVGPKLFLPDNFMVRFVVVTFPIASISIHGTNGRFTYTFNKP